MRLGIIRPLPAAQNSARRGARRVDRVGLAGCPLLLMVSVVLAGCTASPPVPDPSASVSTPGSSASASPSPSASPTAPVDPALVPLFPDSWTADTAATETTRIADAIVAIVDPTTVVNDDAHAEPVAATANGGSYFGVLHTVTLDQTTDAESQVENIVEKLTGSGWSGQDASDQGGVTLVALVSGPDRSRAWFVVVGADQSVPGQPVITVQLASPDLP